LFCDRSTAPVKLFVDYTGDTVRLWTRKQAPDYEGLHFRCGSGRQQLHLRRSHGESGLSVAGFALTSGPRVLWRIDRPACPR
jgi:hypothetical protein